VSPSKAPALTPTTSTASKSSPARPSNAEIQAKNLTLIAGAQRRRRQDLKATARAADPATAPQLAIDSSALGGMYAGAIKLVGTEAGVGVKLDGKWLPAVAIFRSTPTAT
jgi:hypothetical protein